MILAICATPPPLTLNSQNMNEQTSILVTGASSGIGLAVTESLLSAGISVVAVGRSVDSIASHELLTKLKLDLLSDESFTELRNRLKRDQIKISGSFLAAGASGIRVWRAFDVAHSETLMQINYFATLRVLDVVLKHGIRAAQSSHVVVSSVAVKRRYAGMLDYAASKAALECAVGVLAKEAAGFGARINCLRLGIVRTPMTADMLENAEPQLAENYPLGIGEPTVVLDYVKFLLSNSSSWQTGAVIDLSGGYLA